MNRLVRAILLLAVLGTMPASLIAAPEVQNAPWSHVDKTGQLKLDLYFFWSKRCPHCLAAKPVVEKIAAERKWLQLHSLEITANHENVSRYIEMARALGREARSVPGFLYCGRMDVGFDGSGRLLQHNIDRCYRQLLQDKTLSPESSKETELPLFGYFDRAHNSLLLVTVVIAALDAFNPCAFFVLLFLLSLLVNSRSRKRMLYIGGVFVFFSGAIYFLFMAAWLNLFLLSGMQQWFTFGAGALALILAVINIKDFLAPGRGVSLSISEEHKPGLFKRVRALLQANSLPMLTVGTVTLALAANSYELLCTSGLPMVYTRLLTLEGLRALDYYLYLLLYNLVYIVPLLVIVLLFVITLGKRKLQPEEGRLLKLMSGTMMLELGLGLLFVPQMMSSISVVSLAILSAVIVTLAAHLWMKRKRPGGPDG